MLLERDRLTSGTTWHAAGLIVTFGSTSETSTEMRKYTRDLYARLEAETGQSTGFRPVGFIEVAADAGRLEEYRRVSAFNRWCGVDVQEISPREVKQDVPAGAHRRILAGFYVAEEAARTRSTSPWRWRRARECRACDRREHGGDHVLTKRARHRRAHRAGRHRCRVRRQLCRHVGAPAGREGTASTIPLQAAEHYYLITDRSPHRRRTCRCSRTRRPTAISAKKAAA